MAKYSLTASVIPPALSEEVIFHLISPLVHHLNETHICRVCRSIKVTSLCNASDDLGIPNFGSIFFAQIEDDCGHEVIGLVLGYDKIVLEDDMFIK